MAIRRRSFAAMHGRSDSFSVAERFQVHQRARRPPPAAPWSLADAPCSELLQDGYSGASVHRRANRRLQRGELVGRQLLFAAIALLLVLVMQVSMGLAVPW